MKLNDNKVLIPKINILLCFLSKHYPRGGCDANMEEVLYNIEINRNEGQYLGKMYSEIDGIKEFKNERIDRLLRDITVDMQLALDEFSNRAVDQVDRLEDVK